MPKSKMLSRTGGFVSCIEAWRAATKILGVGSHSTVGALARLNGRELLLWIVAAQPDGQRVWRNFAQINLPEDTSTWFEVARGFGAKVARNLLEQGAMV